MDESVVSHSLRELKELYANLFLLMERSLVVETGEVEQEEEIANLNAEIATRMQIIDGRMRRLLKELGDWKQEREKVAPALRDEIDEFFKALEQGLDTLQNQIKLREPILRQEQTEIAALLRKLQKNRQGVRRYRTPPQDPKLFNKKI